MKKILATTGELVMLNRDLFDRWVIRDRLRSYQDVT